MNCQVATRPALSQVYEYQAMHVPDTSGPTPKIPPRPQRLPELVNEQNAATPTTVPPRKPAIRTRPARTEKRKTEVTLFDERDSEQRCI